MTEKIHNLKVAAFVSLTVHLALGWWALRSNPNGQGGVALPVVSSQRLLVQLIPSPKPLLLTLPPNKKFANEVLPKPVRRPPVNVNQARGATTVLNPEKTFGLQAQGQYSDSALPSPDAVQIATRPALLQTPVQAPAVLNLDASQAVKSGELQRRQSGLSAAVDAMQNENSRDPQTRAFAGLAPVRSGIVSETIMADGTRLIKFSKGGCMRVVNPSSRQHDDVRKSVMENC